jgi:hypothetical protein
VQREESQGVQYNQQQKDTGTEPVLAILMEVASRNITPSKRDAAVLKAVRNSDEPSVTGVTQLSVCVSVWPAATITDPVTVSVEVSGSSSAAAEVETLRLLQSACNGSLAEHLAFQRAF